MHRVNKNSLKIKLVIYMIWTLLLAVFLMSITIGYIYNVNAKNKLIVDARSSLKAVSYNVASALDFDDKVVVEEALIILERIKEFESVQVVLNDGSLYTSRKLKRSNLEKNQEVSNLVPVEVFIVGEGGDSLGVLEAQITMDYVLREGRRYVVTIFLVGLAVLTIASGLIYFFIGRALHPIEDLKSSIERISETGFIGSVAVVSQDEIGDLADAFNRMSLTLQKTTVSRDKMEAINRELKNNAEKLVQANLEAEKARMEAEAAAQVKSDFLANMSHEIRTPMNAILGFGDLLQRTDLTEKQKSYLYTISSSGQLLIGIINDILDLSKMEAGKIKLESIDFNLKHVLNDVFKMIVLRTRGSEIEVYIDIDDDVPTSLQGDPSRLKQILINLLGNATKFTKKGEIGIVVKVDEQKDENVTLSFTVKDTGIGIPEEKIHKIFEAFNQADTSTTRKYGGTGLGLAICKTLVNAMGGKMWVESRVGEGSNFIFTLPLQKSVSIRDIAMEPVSYKDLHGLRVLIVDDNFVTRRIHQKHCLAIGMNVLSVDESVPSVLNYLKSQGDESYLPEIILCDIMMGEMSGYDLVREIKSYERFKKIKIIAITADKRIGEANEAEEKGFDGYLPKPIILEQLAQVIRTTLGDKRKKKTIVTRHLAEELTCKGMYILVAEDSLPNQMLLQAFFEELGCNAEFANNGQEAINMLIENKEYDIILMDLQMPVMGGIEATEIIKKAMGIKIPVIAVTAAVLEEDRKKAQEAGMDDFLGKPIDAEELKKVLVKYGRV